MNEQPAKPKRGRPKREEQSVPSSVLQRAGIVKQKTLFVNPEVEEKVLESIPRGMPLSLFIDTLFREYLQGSGDRASA